MSKAKAKGKAKSSIGSADVELIKGIADGTRLAMYVRLRNCGPCSAGDLSSGVGVSQPIGSHHLAKLRFAGVAVGKRQGKLIIYSLIPSAVKRLRELIGTGGKK